MVRTSLLPTLSLLLLAGIISLAWQVSVEPRTLDACPGCMPQPMERVSFTGMLVKEEPQQQRRFGRQQPPPWRLVRHGESQLYVRLPQHREALMRTANEQIGGYVRIRGQRARNSLFVEVTDLQAAEPEVFELVGTLQEKDGQIVFCSTDEETEYGVASSEQELATWLKTDEEGEPITVKASAHYVLHEVDEDDEAKERSSRRTIALRITAIDEAPATDEDDDNPERMPVPPPVGPCC